MKAYYKDGVIVDYDFSDDLEKNKLIKVKPEPAKLPDLNPEICPKCKVEYGRLTDFVQFVDGKRVCVCYDCMEEYLKEYKERKRQEERINHQQENDLKNKVNEIKKGFKY